MRSAVAFFKLVRLMNLAVVLSSFVVLPALAQNDNTGVLLGRVFQKQKQSNQPLPKARVRATNKTDGHYRTVQTNDQGEYQIPFLPSGRYLITASGPTGKGFVEQKLENFRLEFATENSVPYPPNFTLDFQLSRVTIQGLVVDESEHALASAKIELLSEDASVRFGATTDQDGYYEVSDVPQGDYVITASRGEGAINNAGFKITLDREEVYAPTVRITAEGNSVTDQTSQPQSSGLIIDGEKLATLIHAVSVVRNGNFSEQQLSSLPLGGATYMRSFDELALLVAGVSPPPYTPGARGPGVGFGVGTAGQFSVNGMRARSNSFSIDGSDNNDSDVGVRRQGFVALVPQSIESVQEFSITTLLWDAELGSRAGAQINAVTKYGGKEYHGQAYAFYTDSKWNARDFFDYTGGASGEKDRFRRGQFGLAVGGPVIKDRTHLFGSVEREDVFARQENHFASPAPAERSFLNGRSFGSLAVGVPQPFTGTSPLGRNILSLYPLPNNPGGPFGDNTVTRILPADGDEAVASFKVTHQITPNHLFNARYNFTDDGRFLPSVNRAINSTLNSQTRSHNLSLILNSAFNATLFNQARFSFGRTRLDFSEYPGSPFILSAQSTGTISIPQGSFPVDAETGPIGELLIEPFSPVGIDVHYFPQRRASNTFQYADTLSWTRGGHTIKLGFNIRRHQWNSLLDRLYRPQVVFSGGVIGFLSNRPVTPNAPIATTPVTGVQFASAGIASSILQTITTGAPNSTIGLRFTEQNFFFNDNWRVRTGLTIDYGLRYEYNSVPREVNNRIEQAIALQNLPVPGTSRFNSLARLNKLSDAVSAYRRILNGRKGIYEPDRNNFGPHLGLAWTPGNGDKTSVRGGYGIYYDTILGAVISQSRNVFPNEIPVNIDPSFAEYNGFSLNNPAVLQVVKDAQGNFTNPVFLLAPGTCNQFGTCNRLGGAPEDAAALIGQLFTQNSGGGLAFTLAEKNLRSPYAQHWHLSVEREMFGDYLLAATYVGTKGTKLTRLTTPNLGPLATPAVILDDLRFSFPVIDGSRVGSALPSRPDSTLGAFQVYENSASSIYHALQVEVRKRYERGYQLTSAYTWSHAIDDVSDLFPIAGAAILPQNSRNLRAERGSANFDLRHRFAASVIWDLPFFQNAKSTSGILFGGWQISSIFQAQTGQPFTLNLPFDANLDGNLTDRPMTTNGLSLIDQHGPRRVMVAPNRNVTDFFTFNTTGAVGRNTVRGDGFVNLDLSLTKTFRLAEHQQLTFRTESFNLLNRANFGLPIRTIGAPGFGLAVETANPARIIQFALKYRF